MKILYADYEEGFCIIELIGEWNDLLYNDIMLLKRDIVEHLPVSGHFTVYSHWRKRAQFSQQR
jgi:hypothetical protein